jgi:hypothetical protein
MQAKIELLPFSQLCDTRSSVVAGHWVIADRAQIAALMGLCHAQPYGDTSIDVAAISTRQKEKRTMADNPNYPIGTAVVSWFHPPGSLHIRVYSTDNYNVTERCIDQGSTTWTTGSFKQAGSQVSATVWVADDGPHIRVYCTFEDKTTEWGSNPGTPGWTKGTYTVD